MRKLLLSVLLLPLFSHVHSQDINTDPFQNRVIQSYYTKADLTAAQTQDFNKFKWIKYYYIHSFILEAPFTSSCAVMTQEMVDVSVYERYRLPDRRVTLTDHDCGFTITLLSRRELDLLIHYDGVLPDPDIER